jgi:anti-sigma B factor antagonist
VSNIGIKQRQVGSITILDADGKGRIGLRFGGSTVPLPKAVQSLLDEGRNHIVLNLAGVAYIDAGGLGELVSTHITVCEYGGRIKLLNLTETLRDLMKTTKLLTLFDVYRNEAEAILSFEEREFAPRKDGAVS